MTELDRAKIIRPGALLVVNRLSINKSLSVPADRDVNTRFRGLGLVFEAHRRLKHSTLDLSAIKKKMSDATGHEPARLSGQQRDFFNTHRRK